MDTSTKDTDMRAVFAALVFMALSVTLTLFRGLQG
jgi:hypothetical protein